MGWTVWHICPTAIVGGAPALRSDALAENRAVHAVARLMLHGRIDHIQTSWVKLGDEGTIAMLN